MAHGRPLLAAIAAAAPLTAVSAAQAAPGPSNSFSKSEAIIGSESRLAAVLAAQGAPERPAPVRPASMTLDGAFFASRTLGSASSPGGVSGKPDIFGTIALKVRNTPLDGQWRIANALLRGHAASFARSLRSETRRTRIEAINHYVNSRVRFADDSRLHRRPDVWAAANDTLRRRRGDCEDYAIAKLQMLRAAGFSDRDLYLVILKDLVRRSDHAVVVVRSDQRMFVLDNTTDEILDSESIADYRPILTFAAAGGTWTHGYRLRLGQLKLASATVRSASAALPAGK